jgi:hypothetical protein
VVRLEYVPVFQWPALGWLARCRTASDSVTVFHGPRVETTPEWFCEAVWAGSYESGDFDETDLVAGSGGRSRHGRLTFVSAGSTVDRLQSLETDDCAWVSNSLACLLAAVGGGVNRSSGQYFWLFRTIAGGVKKYRRFLPTTAGPVRLTYFDNLSWDGRSLTVQPKPYPRRDFTTFGKYARFLELSMREISQNAAASQRDHPFHLLSTASSGYDSSTVTVLAKRAGLNRVLCFDQTSRGIDDSGEPLARHLNLTPVIVQRSAWSTDASTLPEPPFIASDSHGGDVFFKGAESNLRGKVLLTGYHGDKMWGKYTKQLDEHIVRGDQSGLSLSEYRLTAGMLHCPVAFWGVRQIADVNAISNSPEMAPWDVPGDYSRPICRRIVEAEGVPRESFAMHKRASWVMLHTHKDFLSRDSMRDYLEWLADHRSEFIRHGRVPPSLNRKVDRLENSMRRALARAAHGKHSHLVAQAMKATGLVRLADRLAEGPTYLRRFLFAWALDRHKTLYPKPF